MLQQIIVWISWLKQHYCITSLKQYIRLTLEMDGQDGCYQQHYLNSEETVNDIVNQLKIFYEQLRLLKEKLEKFGLLQSKNEKVNKDNL